eukprot:4087508-Amphidinium_carterae.1
MSHLTSSGFAKVHMMTGCSADSLHVEADGRQGCDNLINHASLITPTDCDTERKHVMGSSACNVFSLHFVASSRMCTAQSHLVELQTIQDCRFACCVQSNHQQSCLFKMDQQNY